MVMSGPEIFGNVEDPAISEPIAVAGLFSAEQLRAGYVEYTCFVEYQWHQGIVTQPVAEPDAPADVVRLFSPYGRKIVTCIAVRNGDWPQMPIPTTSNENEVLIRCKVIPSLPELEADTLSVRYTITMISEYGLLRPITETDGFPSGAGPYTTMSSANNKVPPGNFVTSIIGQ